MSIIYSYPEQSILNPGDMLIGTSVEKVGGKQKNVTKNFTIQQVADFINRGAGFVDPVATDFQIPVFNQGGLKITGSIMSQDSSPSNGVAGTGITIAGTLTTTGSLTVGGGATIGDQVSNIVFDSPTKLLGPILDSGSVQGGVNQILISNQLGKVNWVNYEAGLTYEGTWDATNNTTNGLSNSPALVSGIGISGHFYIVNVAGSTTLDTNSDWHIGDWAVFLDQGGQPAAWQKIDNTSTLVGSGTAGTLSKWTDATTLNDSLVSEAGTVVSVNGDLKVKDTIQATTANTNLKLKGVGTGGIEIMSADGVTDGKIQLNCSVNSHGVTLQSPAHGSTVSYTLILPTSFGGAGDVLTSQGTNPSQLVWTTPTTGTVTGTGTTNTLPIWTNGGAGELGDSILDQLPTAGVFTDTHLSVAGSGGLSTQNLEINKALYDGAASSGSDGFVLTSATSGTDKVISWVDPTTIGDSYDLRTTTVGGNVELSLVSGSATDNSAVIVTGAGGITVTETQGANPTDPTTLTLTGTPGGVTSVGTADADLITIAGTGSGPYTGAVTATANTSAVSSSSNNLATGSQIQTAIDTALAGTLTFKGTFNAATGLITSGVNNGLQLYSGTAGVIAITKGDFYIADTAGSFYNTTAMNVGDEAIALFTVAAAPPGSAITDWSVVPAQSAGGTVTGTGAATQVTFWDGTSNVNGDTAFNWDNTNKRLGIGTASPSEKLDVAGAIMSTGGITGHGASRTTISQEGANGAFWQSYGANSSTYGAFVLRQASSDFSLVRTPLLINSSGNSTFAGNVTVQGTGDSSFVGNVGIGTVSPDTTLTIDNASAGPASSTYATTASNANLHLSAVGVPFYNHLFMGIGSASYAWIQAQHGNSAMQNLALNPLGGNVGIGTASPTQANLVISPSAQSGDLDGLVLAYNPDGAANRVRAQLKIDTFNGVLELKSGADVLTTKINSAGDSYFNNGNVGIGTDSPSAKLDIEGDFEAEYALKFTNTKGTGNVYGFRSNGTNGEDLSLYHGANRIQRWDQNGYSIFDSNVGIGTASPDAKLDVGVNNIITLDDTGSSTGFIGLGSYNDGTKNRAQGASYYGFGIEVDRPNARMSMNSYDSNGIISTSNITLKNNGNVGIGTDSPDAKLQVDGGIQMADDTDTASANKVGTLKYRVSGNNSYVDMCMQTGAATYAWVNIVQNNW